MSMTVIGVDPGSEESGLVVWDGDKVWFKGIAPNLEVVSFIALMGVWAAQSERDAVLAIEYTKPYVLWTKPNPKEPRGRPYVPEQVFTTAYWVGQMSREWTAQTTQPEVQLPRSDILRHLGANKRKILGRPAPNRDSQVLDKLKTRFGEKGTKSNPGVTYGFKSHIWQAFAVAVTFLDSQRIPDF
ncbi:MAG: hypothetical protein AAF438_06810 [Pseudomonadota bacterium]